MMALTFRQPIPIRRNDIMAGQAPQWRGFYEQAWSVRAGYLRELIAAGERNIPRLLRRLEAHERKFRVEGSVAGACFGRMVWPKEMEVGPAGVPLLRPSSFRGNGALVPFHTRDNIANFIVDYIDETGPYDAIVELGCGYGRNLFDIYYGGGPQDCRYYGGELTESGVAVAQEIAALDPAMKANFFAFDYLDPVLDIASAERVLVFTVHSIEQVCQIDAKLFEVIAAAAGRVDCVHFEPFGFQLAELGPASREHRSQAIENSWNLNFAAALQEAQQKHGVRISCLVTESFLPADPHNPTSLAIWHAGEKAA
jgi:SAM-dependent methyltransferase